MDSTATVPTASASKYLQQLCKHWSHRFAVDFDADHGTVSLPAGTLTLDAGPAALTLRLAAPDATTLDRAEPVVAEHLQRFAFRETLAFDWVRA
jgi:hypothetical protein